MTVAFTGHRKVKDPDGIYDCLIQTVTQLILKGADTFICGGAVGFDTLAAQAVLQLRDKYPIRLVLAIPCEGQEAKFSPAMKATYARIRSAADAETVLYPYYQKGCMHARNRYMVDRCDCLVAYCHQYTGGTAYTVDYAKRMNKTIFNLPCKREGSAKG